MIEYKKRPSAGDSGGVSCWGLGYNHYTLSPGLSSLNYRFDLNLQGCLD